jgi:hypothetical protein
MNTIRNIVILGCATTLAFADTDRRKMPLADCPADVQATVNANTRGGVVEDVKFIKIEDKSIYVADVDLPGDADLKIYISGAGKLVKIREDVPLKDVPEAVQKALQSLGGELDDVEKEMVDAKVTYYADIDRPGQADLEVELSSDGTILQKTEEKN